MRLGITAKLFVAVLATVVLVVVIMSVVGRVGFQREFRRYVEQIENRHSEALSAALAERYREEGSWEFLRGERWAWRRFLYSQLRATPVGRVEPAPAARDGARDPPRFERPMRRGTLRLALRLAVLDENKQFVAGYRGVDAGDALFPITVDGASVGWIARVPLERLTAPDDLRFLQAQYRTLVIAALVAVLGAGLAAAALARRFLAPARNIGAASQRLAAGDYSVRVTPGSRDEFGQLAQDFNLLAVALERNERARREFMAGVAHELRTPLAVMHAELAAIADGVRKWSPQALESLQAEVRSLTTLVQDVYDLSLADVGALAYRKEMLDLREELRGVLSTYAERFRAAGLVVTAEGLEGPPLTVHADPGRLRQIFANLLGNALAYTAAPGHVEISCIETKDEVLVEVRDSSPGVPADALPRLFERFYRVEDSRSRAHGGAGLGLALCRSIVEAHGGSIVAAASPLGGLAVAVKLPLARGKPA